MAGLYWFSCQMKNGHIFLFFYMKTIVVVLMGTWEASHGDIRPDLSAKLKSRQQMVSLAREVNFQPKEKIRLRQCHIFKSHTDSRIEQAYVKCRNHTVTLFEK